MLCRCLKRWPWRLTGWVIYELVDIEPIANHVLFGWDEAS